MKQTKGPPLSAAFEDCTPCMKMGLETYCYNTLVDGMLWTLDGTNSFNDDPSIIPTRHLHHTTNKGTRFMIPNWKNKKNSAKHKPKKKKTSVVIPYSIQKKPKPRFLPTSPLFLKILAFCIRWRLTHVENLGTKLGSQEMPLGEAGNL